MTFLFDNLKKLHEEELYSDVAYLGNIMQTLCDNKSDLLSPQLRYQSTVFYADALYELDQFQKSANIYYRALLQRKNIQGKVETRRAQTEYTNEAEIRFRLHKCLLRQEKYPEALGVLEAIPARLRPPKVRASLAKLFGYQENGKKRSVTTSANALENYRTVVKEIPYALHSLVELMALGVTHDEVESLVLCSTSGQELVATMDWFEPWMQAQGALARREVAPAAHMLKELNANSQVANNIQLLSDLSKAYFLAGEREKAINGLQRIHASDPCFLNGMDTLALLLFQEKRIKELENMATKLVSQHPTATESWIALGYLCRGQAAQQTGSERMKKLDKALYFSFKACNNGGPQPRVEAMLLKAGVLMEHRRLSDAAQHLTEALTYDRCCFELYEALVECKLEDNKLNEARTVARTCRDTLGHQSPRPLTLAASVLAKAEDTSGQAQKMLEEAVRVAPYLLNAVYLLVELYDKQGQYEKAISLLRQQTNQHVNSKLHRLLGNLLSKTNRSVEASDSYRHALTLEPNDTAATMGLENLESNHIRSFATPEVTPATAGFAQNLALAPRRASNRSASSERMDDNDGSFLN